MSYLDPLRLHFAGSFQAAPSTVNNDLSHFNNATFKPEYQQRASGSKDGWWNPAGDAVFRLSNCAVTSAYIGGVPVAGDPVLALKVGDSDTQPPAKMVDLDPEQQMVSQIWGLQVRLCTAAGANVLRSDFDLTSFTEIWVRDITDSPRKVGDSVFSAMYQTTLSNLEWFDIGGSHFLEHLQQQSGDGLSIKFNVDGYDMVWGSPTFTYGRVVGTIGPHRANDPRRYTLGRHLSPAFNSQGQQSFPVNFCAAVVDEATSKVLIDLGNALPTNGIGGSQSDVGVLTVAYQSEQDWKPIGTVDYGAANWYTTTAGVAAVPGDRALTKDELNAIGSSPVGVLLTGSPPQPQAPAMVEPDGGLYVRADQFVYRLSPGESAHVDLFATQWGRALANAQISVAADASGLQGDPKWPDPAVPPNAISFPAAVSAGADGRATLTIVASDPGNPRGYIDGQVYGVRPLPNPPPPSQLENSSDFISLLVWDDFKPETPITWHGSMQPIFQQYANLYPIMARFLDMSKYEEICIPRNLQILRLAFGLDPSDPNSMPVTRDLSEPKRKAILSWLMNVGKDGKPLLGVAPAAHAKPAALLEKAEEAEAAKSDAIKGGKSAAIARRMGKAAITKEAQ
jgi:hypothetical protein